MGLIKPLDCVLALMKHPPLSLKNIQKVLRKDVNVDLEDISLDKWAQQGILLLNTALTVRWKSPATHMRVWLPFTKYIIDHLNTNGNKVVFVAWGAFAYDKLKDIDQDPPHTPR